jgi:NOL1/NOP2/sun family putative RNA methylase
MVPVIVLDPKPGETVLDLCAAPGSKTTQISQHMENSGLLVANEVNRTRMKGLLQNAKRCGVVNEAVIALPGEKIGNILPDYFDRVLLDAPCSVEGTIRKSRAVLDHWGLKNIEKMSRIQKGLIVSGFRALRPGGIMVYSTCTIAPEENEGVIDYLLKKFPEAEIMPMSLPDFKMRGGVVVWDKVSFDSRVKDCARVLPQDNDTAPFFIAKITKRGMQRTKTAYHGRIEFQNKVIEKFCRRFDVAPDRFSGFAVFQSADEYSIASAAAYSFLEIKSVRKGLEVGKIYDNEIKPDNDFVQLFGRRAERNALEVKDWELKKFLRGENIGCPPRLEGFVIIKYKNLPMGIGRANGREIRSSVHPDRRIP